jgi:5-formyltetrahydrofolate cyclo-ligase
MILFLYLAVCFGFAVALSYSLQILDEEIIPLTPNDVLVDALVTASGIIPITPAALDRSP